MLGDVVNVAARLCAEAGAGEILVADGVRAATTHGWHYDALAPMELRGREEKVDVFRVEVILSTNVILSAAKDRSACA